MGPSKVEKDRLDWTGLETNGICHGLKFGNITCDNSSSWENNTLIMEWENGTLSKNNNGITFLENIFTIILLQMSIIDTFKQVACKSRHRNSAFVKQKMEKVSTPTDYQTS